MSIELINVPQAKSRLRKVIETGITSLAWGIWFYLLIPIINILMWLVSGEIIFNRLFAEHGLDQFYNLLKQMGLIIFCCFIIIQGWATYNYVRFGRKNRRKGLKLGADEVRMLAEFHHMDHQLLNQLRCWKEVVWPPSPTSDMDIPTWIHRKQRKLAGHEVTEIVEDHHVHMVRFHDIHPSGEPSIAFCIITVVVCIYAVALFVMLFLS